MLVSYNWSKPNNFLMKKSSSMHWVLALALFLKVWCHSIDYLSIYWTKTVFTNFALFMCIYDIFEYVTDYSKIIDKRSSFTLHHEAIVISLKLFDNIYIRMFLLVMCWQRLHCESKIRFFSSINSWKIKLYFSHC